MGTSDVVQGCLHPFSSNSALVEATGQEFYVSFHLDASVDTAVPGNLTLGHHADPETIPSPSVAAHLQLLMPGDGGVPMGTLAPPVQPSSLPPDLFPLQTAGLPSWGTAF